MKIDNVQLPTASAGEKEDKKLKQACKDFETIFMNFMLKSMRKTVTKNDLFGSGSQEEMFQDMMDSEYCKSAAKNSSLGIADVLYSQITHQTQHVATSEVKTDDNTDRRP